MRISLIALLISAGFILFSCKSARQKLVEKIETNEQALKSDSVKINSQVTTEETQLYLEFVNKYPDDTLCSSYLFKAAELDQRMRKFSDGIALYKQFNQKYPNHQKAPTSLFLQAFLYETEVHNKDSAKIVYKQFLEKYPNHALAPSAKATLDQLESGMTDEDLVKMFEARLDSSKKK